MALEKPIKPRLMPTRPPSTVVKSKDRSWSVALPDEPVTLPPARAS